jgi:methylated-DNA-protein-cysteine methyltransferase-like protein
VAAGQDHGLAGITLKTPQRQPFTQRVIAAIKNVPRRRVATYRDIALYCGSPAAARQVAWILHAMSGKEKLPWHRIVNARGMISLPKAAGYEEQKQLLIEEGIVFNKEDAIDLKKYSWIPTSKKR